MAVVPKGETPKPVAPRKFDSVTQAIDTFISEGWERRGVKPAPAGDMATVRRAAFADTWSSGATCVSAPCGP